MIDEADVVLAPERALPGAEEDVDALPVDRAADEQEPERFFVPRRIRGLGGTSGRNAVASTPSGITATRSAGTPSAT